MSAPAPPPHRVPLPSSTHGQRYSTPDAAPGAGPRNGPMTASNGSPAGAGKRSPFPHIRDLIAEAESRVDALASISKLLEAAKNACTNADTYSSFGRPELAYIEWIVARYVMSTVVPMHKDSPSIPGFPRLQQLHREIITQLKASASQFDRLESLIQADNERNGTAPKTPVQRSQKQQSRPTSLQSAHSRSSSSATTPQHVPATASDLGRVPQHPRQKPPVSPKPRQFQSAAAAAAEDDLADRFARLRHNSQSSPSNSPRPGSGPGLRTTFPYPADDSISETSHRPPSSFSVRDSSLDGGTLPSPHAPRSAVDPGALPKLPDPTYAPRPGIPPLRPSTVSRNSLSKEMDRPFTGTADTSPSGQTTRAQVRTVYKPRPENAETSEDQSLQTPRRRRRALTHGPVEMEITADKLYDYLRKYDVLLIDVRSRDAYDEGHIMATFEMCIEPTALRPNMSAEELQEAMVLAPENEQSLFARRDEFELLVYYDSATPSAEWLQRNAPGSAGSPLKDLYETLTLYNNEKPLQRPPILLMGGLEAWVDILGPQSLQHSNTLPRSMPNSRPILRRPAVSGSDRLGVRRKRREYNPMDEEEERKWRERARSESIVLNTHLQQQQQQQQQMQAHGQEDGDQGAYNATSLDDAEQRFPDLTTFSHRHAEEHPPQRQPPQIPYYPTPQPSSYVASVSSPPPPPSLAPLHETTPRPLPPAPLYSQPPPIPSRPPPAIQRPSYSGVSERIISPTAMANQVASQLAPYIPPKLERLPRTGLYNFGVTCYMNATIQCLSATIPLTAFFLDGQFMKHIQKNNWKGSKGLMPELYANLIKNLWTAHDADTLRPTNFRSFCGRLNKEWGANRQQDAKEFLEFLIDILHEDFNQNWEKTPLQTLTEAEEAQRERMAPVLASRIEWDRYLHRDSSKLTELFAGQHISRLKCKTCGFTSTTYEAFYSLSVEIPQSKNGHNPTIYDCLDSYCTEEKLSGNEVWRCPRCKAEREATKQIIITRVPEFLIVHFKRFSADHSERARKIHSRVSFPLEGLDLGRYVLPLPENGQLYELSARYRNQQLTSQANTPPFKYDAYGVIRHIGGTIASGHYIAMVRDQGRKSWREFNDSRVHDFKPESLPADRSLQNEQAYIVFYQRNRDR